MGKKENNRRDEVKGGEEFKQKTKDGKGSRMEKSE